MIVEGVVRYNLFVAGACDPDDARHLQILPDSYSCGRLPERENQKCKPSIAVGYRVTRRL